jgi:hypothetical protein
LVTDARAALTDTWTATVSSSDFTTGGASSAETIPAGDVTYDPGTVSTTGTITATPTAPILLAGTVQTAVAATGIVGNNTASWDPALSVAIPAGAVAGTYSGVVTQSVS